MAEVLFFIASIGAIAGAIGVVVLRNPFYSVLALVGHLLSLAALFLLLRAEFVAAAQVVVYAGAVMVLYVFVVAYVGGADQPPLGARAGRGLKVASGLFAGALFVELCLATLGSGLSAIDSEGAGYNPNPPPGVSSFGSPAQIGELLLTKFLLVFEVASFLLLIAAVGAVVLARRRGGPGVGEETRLSVAELVRPTGTGTTAEGVGGPPGVPSHPRLPEAEAGPEPVPSTRGAGW